ncbi:Na/Pi cotransporter family protein [Ruminococcus sp. Marseille-P6503]|uniref:Na/Pi cotransporter family protein n=1 Tax=Ruminococcus sp. Marseille-P6503 TaxID=2364796 RepID=UPI000F522745|nr:Na/Pi cotransporter family protein [Ruminococcus sp. Marseille-P6503]
MDIFMVLTLVGGLALFLYGMNVMGTALEKLAGGRLEKIFEKLTSNPLKAVLLGLSVTAVIQSSSATTVMLVGFVNAGLMKLRQAIGVIMGANIGTTVTAWILSLSGVEGDSFFIQMLKPSSFSPILAIIGVFLVMLSKNDKKQNVGTILMGFAVLMFGMDMMSGAVEPLKDVPEFANILTMFQNPVLGVLAGALLTAIIQSSSASVGILQALSSTGAITFGAALPIILGQNIGTCITAIISSIGTSKNAKRVAVVHLYFNIIGTLLFLTVFYILNMIFSFSFVDDTVGAGNIAVVHTIFNFTTTIVLLPFINQLEKLAYLTIRDNADDKSVRAEDQFKLLDDRFLQSPSFAIEQCRTVAANMADIAKSSIGLAIELLAGYNDDKAEQINGMESLVDKYEDRLGTYLVKLSSADLSHRDSQSVATLLHTIGDFERISDHAKNIVAVAKEKRDKNIEFSAQAVSELKVICSAVTEILELAVKAFTEQDLYSAYLVEPLEEVVDQLQTKLKSRHVKRLQKGMCTIELGFIFTDLLTNLERVSDHCSNIAVCLIQVNDDNFETHEYLRTVKTSGEAFDSEVEKYQQMFVLPKKDF